MINGLIIIPTYNEAFNIVRLIDLILNQQGEEYKFDILVVDDNSPDGTSKLIADHQNFERNVFLIRRKKKEGRGSAVLEGFQFALKKGDYEQVIEMDGDFSHDPTELGKLLKKNQENDVTVGSRYLKNSKIIGWSLKRIIFSRLANFYARRVLRIPLQDYTNGYRCYKIDLLKVLDFSKIRSAGHILLSEIAYRFYLEGAKFCEIPTIFVNRRRGNSNVGFHEIKEAFFAIPRIYRTYAQERHLFKSRQKQGSAVV